MRYLIPFAVLIAALYIGAAACNAVMPCPVANGNVEMCGG